MELKNKGQPFAKTQEGNTKSSPGVHPAIPHMIALVQMSSFSTSGLSPNW